MQQDFTNKTSAEYIEKLSVRHIKIERSARMPSHPGLPVQSLSDLINHQLINSPDELHHFL